MQPRGQGLTGKLLSPLGVTPPWEYRYMSEIPNVWYEIPSI